MKYAAEKLPKKAERASGEKWRATRGAALALLGKVFLYRGSMTEGTQKSAYFQESKKYSLEVINSGEYQLEGDFKNLWMWYNTANKHGKESIFEVEFGYVGVPGDVANASRFHIDGGLNIVDKNFGSYMYYRYGPSYAWDLATGESIREDEIVTDAGSEPPAPPSLIEVLEHGREGEPRWVVADTTHGPRSPVVARRVAAAARAGAGRWASI